MIMVSLCNSLSLFQILYFYFIALACSFTVWDKCENCFPDGQYCTQTPNNCLWHFITTVWKDAILTLYGIWLENPSLAPLAGIPTWTVTIYAQFSFLQNNHMYCRTSVTCNLWNHPRLKRGSLSLVLLRVNNTFQKQWKFNKCSNFWLMGF